MIPLQQKAVPPYMYMLAVPGHSVIVLTGVGVDVNPSRTLLPKGVVMIIRINIITTAIIRPYIIMSLIYPDTI
jgi:hypothetical protein